MLQLLCLTSAAVVLQVNSERKPPSCTRSLKRNAKWRTARRPTESQAAQVGRSRSPTRWYDHPDGHAAHRRSGLVTAVVTEQLTKHGIIKNGQIDRKCRLQAVFKSITVTAKCNLCVLFTSKSAGQRG